MGEKSKVKTRFDMVYNTGDARALIGRSLPHVMAVLGNFSQRPEDEKDDIEDRKFLDVDRDNFDKVLEKVSPRISVTVKPGTAESEQHSLSFNELKDFSPDALAKVLCGRLLEERRKLKELKTTIQRRKPFSDILADEIGSFRKAAQEQVDSDS